MTGEVTSGREVCFLVGAQGEILWRDASESPVAMPDSRERWEAIWRFRGELTEIAHSHPVGPLALSAEDETTRLALLAALGRAVDFSVVAPDGMVRVGQDGGSERVLDEPGWAAELRLASGMGRR
jgi:hypothetical protein